jgi:hypothetical protein
LTPASGASLLAVVMPNSTTPHSRSAAAACKTAGNTSAGHVRQVAATLFPSLGTFLGDLPSLCTVGALPWLLGSCCFIKRACL